MELIRAAKNGDIRRVHELLDSGVDPNIQNYAKDTALINASLAGRTDIVRLLLDHGADPNIINNFRATALIYAAYNDFTEIAELLLQHGADPNIIDDDGDTALMIAESEGHDDIARLIRDHIDIDTYDEPSDPDINLLKDEAARYIQTIMRARFETDKKRKLTKRRYGIWASPKTEREKDRRYMDLIRQIDEDDPMRGYERYSIYPERLLPPKKGGRRGRRGKRRKYYTRRRY